MARAGETNLGTQGDLFLGQIGTQGFYAHSDLRWVGVMASSGTTPTGGASTDPTTPSVLYRNGDIVVYNNRIFVAQQNNDNVVPGLVAGSVLRAADPAAQPPVTAIIASAAQITESEAAWEEIGNDDVLGARPYNNMQGYEVNNLVFDGNGGLFAVRQDIPHSTTARPSSQDPANQPTLYTRVGGAPIGINFPERTETQATLSQASGQPTVQALTFTSPEAKLAFVRYVSGNASAALPSGSVTPAQLATRSSANSGAQDAAQIMPPATALVTSGTVTSNLLNMSWSSSTPGNTSTHNVRYYPAWNSANSDGGPLYNGTGNTVLVPNFSGGAGSVPAGLNRFNITLALEVTAGLTFIEGNHIQFDVDSAGNMLTISADQQAISRAGAIAYDAGTGVVSLSVNSDEFTQAGDQLNLHINENARTGGTRNDAGSGIEAGSDGIRLEIDDVAGNVLEVTSNEGLFVGEATLSTQAATGSNRVAEVRLAKNQQGTTNTDNDSFNVTNTTAAASTGTSTSNSVTVARETNGDLRFTGVPVASWAQTQTGAVTIPASKLPNLTLGNTHTYTGTASTTAAALLTQVIANAGGQRDSTGAIEWHVGDLLIIANTNTATGQDANNGIFVYVGDQQTAPNVPTLESMRTTGQSDSDLLMALFRNLITSTNAGRPTIANNGGTASTLSSVNIDRDDALVKGANPGDAPVTRMTQQHLQYNNSTDSTMLQLDLVTPLADTAGVTQFVNRMRIGGTSYIFGLEPPAPTMSYSPGNGVNQNLYRSSDIAFTVPTTLTAPAGSFEGSPLAATDYAITMPAGDIDVTATGNSDSRALGTSRALPTISSISNAATSVVTFASDPNLLVGQTFVVAGVTPTGYNGTYTVSSIGAGNAITTATDNSAITNTFTVATITQQGTNITVTLDSAPAGLAANDTFTITGATPTAYNQTYTVGSITGAVIITTPPVAIPANTAYTANSGSVALNAAAVVTAATGTRSTDGVTISAVRSSNTVINTTVTVDEPQTNAGAQVMTVTDNNVGFTPVSGFNYTDIVSGNPPLITYRDARTGPSISPTSVSRSVFDGGAQAVTISLRNSAGEITAGTGYDVAGYARRQGTTGPFGSTTTGTGTVSQSITVDFSANRTYNYQFPMIANPRNGQPNTNPANAAIAFSFYTPFYLIASSGTPVLADITSATQVTAASWNNNLGSAYNNLLVSGTANDNIYLVVPMGALTGSIATQVVGAPGNTPGTLLTAGNNISRPNNAGTAVVYNIYQFGSLIGTSVRVNLVRP